MNYDTEGKHYTAFASGNWRKVAILSEINGEKVNGRFIFSRYFTSLSLTEADHIHAHAVKDTPARKVHFIQFSSAWKI